MRKKPLQKSTLLSFVPHRNDMNEITKTRQQTSERRVSPPAAAPPLTHGDFEVICNMLKNSVHAFTML